LEPPPVASTADVVVLCGLPASGKTTTAQRLHANMGGVLIRSCDVYQQLGIDLPDWIRRTQGFSNDVTAYEQLRDQAYEEMARLLEKSLAFGAGLVIVDAVHGERAKRQVIFEVCWTHRARPLLLWCRCDDPRETERRIVARRGREIEPEHEASDMCVFQHISGLWEDPSEDVPIAIYDTCSLTFAWRGPAGTAIADMIRSGLRG